MHDPGRRGSSRVSPRRAGSRPQRQGSMSWDLDGRSPDDLEHHAQAGSGNEAVQLGDAPARALDVLVLGLPLRRADPCPELFVVRMRRDPVADGGGGDRAGDVDGRVPELADRREQEAVRVPQRR